MKLLKFTLKGNSAFFKKPEVNAYFYFTYGHIHKVALLGIFGAVLGYSGYSATHMFTRTKQELSPGYPEFYEKLQRVQVSVVPHYENGMIPKKIQRYNNSVGYASREQGGNLIIKEQWLEYPGWDIYVQLKDEESDKLADALLHNRCVYIPYLGKNDHPADISDVQVLEGNSDSAAKIRLHSLFPKEQVILSNHQTEARIFKYEEMLPDGLDELTNLYQYKVFILTNQLIKTSKSEIIHADGLNLIFY